MIAHQASILPWHLECERKGLPQEHREGVRPAQGRDTGQRGHIFTCHEGINRDER